jgi:hypothetical protein
MPSLRRFSSAAPASAPTTRRVFATGQPGNVSDAGISDVVISSRAEAKGWNVWVNKEFLARLVELGNAAGEVKARYGHPAVLSDPIGTEIGYFANFRYRQGGNGTPDQVIADLTFVEGWDQAPKMAENIRHIQAIARSASTLIGASIEFRPGELLYPSDPLNTKELMEDNIVELYAIAITSDPATNEQGLFNRGPFADLQHQLSQGFDRLYSALAPSDNPSTPMKEFFAKLFGQKKAGKTFKTRAGLSLRATGDAIEAGAIVAKVDADGNATDQVEAGEHTLEDGTVITVNENSVVKNVTDPEADKPEPVSENAPKQKEDAESAAEPASDESGQRARTVSAQEFAALQKEVEALRAQPAAEPVSDKASDERQYARRELGRNGMHFARNNRDFTAGQIDDITESIKMIQFAKRGHSEYRFNRQAARSAGNTRAFATGEGVNFNDLLARCAEIVPELFHQIVIEEGLADTFNIIDDFAINGDSSVSIELPNLSDTATASYLQAGIGCTYTADGETVLDKRTMTVAPWHYYREYCPKEWGNSFRGMAYVNDETLPYEAVILEFLFSKIRNAWENAIINGDTGGSDPFDGLLTLVAADTNIPAAQQVVSVPTASNAVAEIEKVLDAIPSHMRANFMDLPLLWMLPSAFLERYVRNYRSTFSALPYNDRFEKFGPDSALVNADFTPTEYIDGAPGTVSTPTQIVTPAENLFLGIGKNMEVDVQFHDAGKEQYLFVRVEGHTGVQYALSDQVAVGTTAAS